MKIQDIEAKTLLDRATIRFYEREGLLNPKGLIMVTGNILMRM